MRPFQGRESASVLGMRPERVLNINSKTMPRNSLIVAAENASVARYGPGPGAAATGLYFNFVRVVRGFPIPLITWKVNDTILLPNNRTRITQKNDGKERRKSTLVIRNLTEADYGRYRCVARSVDKKSSHVDRTIGPKTMSKPKVTTTTNRPKPGKPCDFPMNRDFCLNGGTCFFTQSMVEYSCECPNGFVGQKCETKTSDQLSTYHHTPLSTCKVGLFTKYDKC
ncbi:hypothetical protein Zmor_013333 [Zophobas morio]|uniref:Protein vein n=1 Tax=Zophobas morio TaxID=2755281 RepID=A0AA38IDB2_9CUCU|nr:hypothetical protein Zmor_013333 [Zophobas morio]